MTAIDYERAWLGMKTYVTSKASHGQRDLLREMTDLEIEHQVPEGQEGFSDLPAPRKRRSGPVAAPTAAPSR